MPDPTIAETEMAAALMAAYDEIVERVKARRPIGTDKKPTELGFVYSQLIQGMLIDPRDYTAPWSPSGASSMQDAVETGKAPPNTAAPATGTAPAGDGPAPDPADGTLPPAPAPDPKYLRAMDAAFKTAMLVDRLLMVTKDGTYREYPGAGRKLSTAYYGMVNGMQPLPPPPIAPDVQKRIDEARKVLYVPDDEGDLVLKSKLYKAYEKNARDYAQAVADYADAQALASTDPAAAQAWPVKSKALRRAVDEAWDTLKTEGAEKVEAALDVIKSVGVGVDARLIAKARQVFDIWNLGLAGAVPADVPYAYCSPTSWPDYDADDSGWMTVEITSKKSARYMGKRYDAFNKFQAHSSSSSTSVSGRASYFGFGARGGYHRADSHSDTHSEADSRLSTMFKNSAKGVRIRFQFGIVDVIRPWLMGDLFYLKNWYLVGNKRHSISDGTIDGQADSDKALLPMVPMQFLVVRNLVIEATDWGSDGNTLSTLFGESGGAWDESGSGWSAGANYGCGVFSATANVSREQAKSGASTYGRVESEQRRDHEAHFDGKKLTIKGAQIVAFLCSIVPPCPLTDDPGLADKGAPAAPAAGTAAAPQPVPAH